MNAKILGVIRELSLVFFLGIVGLRYGFAVVDALAGPGAYLGLVSLVVGVVAMMVGYLIGRYVFKINWVMLSGAICGGMTSTPGLGAAVEAAGSDDPAAGYGATYPFALLGMVIFTIILHSLPM
jgi:putative transport protein